MTHISFDLRLFFLGFLLLIIVQGCGKRQTVSPFGIGGRRTINYEIAWVDQQIIVSDSLFTLIRAERIDSTYVDGSSYPVSVTTPALMFRVIDEECVVSVNLLGSKGEVIRPLLVRNLSRGYYKLTVDLGRFSGEWRHPDTDFYLKADYCGQSVSQSIRQASKLGH